MNIRRYIFDKTRLGKSKPPFIFICGFQKCGTTTLYDWLSHHPQIHVGPIKENNYPSRGRLFFATRYRNYWPHTEPGYLLDGSHQNTHNPRGMLRLARNFKNGKFIFILRNTIQRAYSHWRHNIRNGRDHEEFGRRIDDELQILSRCDLDCSAKKVIGSLYKQSKQFDYYGSYVARSIYWPWLDLEKTGALDTFVVCLDELERAPALTLAKIYDWLNLEKITIDLVPKNCDPGGGGCEQFYERVPCSVFSPTHSETQYFKQA